MRTAQTAMCRVRTRGIVVNGQVLKSEGRGVEAPVIPEGERVEERNIRTCGV